MKSISKYARVVLIIFVGVVLLSGIFLKLSIDKKKSREKEVASSIKKLEALAANKNNLNELESQIQQLVAQTQTTRSIEEVTTKDNISKLNVRFTGSVVVGDSITEGLSDYKILSNDKVVYKRGVSIKSTTSLLQTAIGLNPTNIFLAFGMNDVESYKSDISSFIEDYKEKIEYIKQNLPNAKIYVNNIQPASGSVAAKRTDFSRVPQYNEQLVKMCDELAITYIDNQYILKENPSLYEPDGIHVSISYYSLWLENMAEKAGI